MSWIISILIVLFIIILMIGIAWLICKFELELVWCYVNLVILLVGLLIAIVTLVHKILF